MQLLVGAVSTGQIEGCFQEMQVRKALQTQDMCACHGAGNSPWPIGVTSVGIHERSAREKISHVMNGAAHVMNNEATRKYLQALKRLLTFMQRAHPTDPSRSVEFDGYKDAGRGSLGGGSDKQVRAMLKPGREGQLQLGSASSCACTCLTAVHF